MVEIGRQHMTYEFKIYYIFAIQPMLDFDDTNKFHHIRQNMNRRLLKTDLIEHHKCRQLELAYLYSDLSIYKYDIHFPNQNSLINIYI
jgi:alpha-galactosidase